MFRRIFELVLGFVVEILNSLFPCSSKKNHHPNREYFKNICGGVAVNQYANYICDINSNQRKAYSGCCPNPLLWTGDGQTNCASQWKLVQCEHNIFHWKDADEAYPHNRIMTTLMTVMVVSLEWLMEITVDFHVKFDKKNRCLNSIQWKHQDNSDILSYILPHLVIKKLWIIIYYMPVILQSNYIYFFIYVGFFSPM